MNFPPIGRSFEAIKSHVEDTNLDNTPLANANISNFANAASAAVSGSMLGSILGGQRNWQTRVRA